MNRNKFKNENRILQQIWLSLKSDSGLNLKNIKMKLDNGILLVKGEVDDEEMKQGLIDLIHMNGFNIPMISHVTIKKNKGLIGDANDTLRMI